jgi:hypothetical protein
MSAGTGSTLILRPTGLTAITFDLDANNMAADSYVVDLNTLRFGEEDRELMEYAQRTGAEGGDRVGVQNPLVPLTFAAVVVADSRADMVEMAQDLRVALMTGGYLEFKPEDLPGGVTSSFYAYLPSGPGGLVQRRKNRWDAAAVDEGGTLVYRVVYTVSLMTYPLLLSDPDSPITAVSATTIENRDDTTGDDFVTLPAATVIGDSRALVQLTMRNMEPGEFDDIIGVYIFPRIYGLTNYRIVFEPGTIVVGATEWVTTVDATRSDGSYQRLTPVTDDLSYRLQFQVTNWTDFVGRHLLMIACRDNGGSEGDFEVRGGWSLGTGELKDPTPWASTQGEFLEEWQLFSLGEIEFPGTRIVEVEELNTDPYYELEVRRISGGSGTFDVDFFIAGPVDLRPLYVDCSGQLFLSEDWLLLSNLEYPVQIAHIVKCGVFHLNFNINDPSDLDCGSDAAIDNLSDSGNDDFTVEAWIRAEGYGNLGEGRIFDKDNGTGNGWMFYLDSVNGLIFYQYANQDAIARSGLDDITADGMWHHVAATFIDTGAAPRLWVDGIEVSYAFQQAWLGPTADDSAIDLHIGNRADLNRAWQGDIAWTRLSSNLRYTTATFAPPVRCSLPAIDANTVAQWIGAEGTGSIIDNQEGTAALDGTQTSCIFGCDCDDWKLQGPVKPLGLLPLANPGKEATDGYRLYFLWERRDGTLVVDDDFAGYDANWQEISDCDVDWVIGVTGLTRTEGTGAQLGGNALTTRTVGPVDYSGWAGTDYFCCTVRTNDVAPVNHDFELWDGIAIYRRTAQVEIAWCVVAERKTDFVIDAGAPNWNSIDDAVIDRAAAMPGTSLWDNWRWSAKDPASAQPNDFGASWNYFLALAPWFVYTDAATRCAGNPTPVKSGVEGSETGTAEQLLLSSMADARNLKMKARVYAFLSDTVTDAEVGVVFHCSDGTSGSEDCYYLSIDVGADLLTLYRYVAGVPTSLGSVGFTVAAATWYWLGVEAFEGTIKCYAHANENDLWDNVLMEIEDTTHVTGKCGLMVKDGMGRFDDVEVWVEDDRYNPQDEAEIEVEILARSINPHAE